MLLMADGGPWWRVKIPPYRPLCGTFITDYGKTPTRLADICHCTKPKNCHWYLPWRYLITLKSTLPKRTKGVLVITVLHQKNYICIFYSYPALFILYNFLYPFVQVCPVCALRVGVDMVAHIALQHGSILKISFSLFVNICFCQLLHDLVYYHVFQVSKLILVHYLSILRYVA